jgi:hypothetical protein
VLDPDAVRRGPWPDEPDQPLTLVDQRLPISARFSFRVVTGGSTTDRS